MDGVASSGKKHSIRNKPRKVRKSYAINNIKVILATNNINTLRQGTQGTRVVLVPQHVNNINDRVLYL